MIKNIARRFWQMEMGGHTAGRYCGFSRAEFDNLYVFAYSQDTIHCQ